MFKVCRAYVSLELVQFAVAVAERLDAAERKERGNRVRRAF